MLPLANEARTRINFILAAPSHSETEYDTMHELCTAGAALDLSQPHIHGPNDWASWFAQAWRAYASE